MTREWKPGDVVLIEAGCHANRQVAMRSGSATNPGWSYLTEQGMTKWTADTAGVVTVVRPLVVIDPEDREQVERLLTAVNEWADRVPYSDMRKADDLTHLTAGQAALRSLVAPPKPDEPMGLGAVVEDDRGERWVRDKTTTTVKHWKRARGEDQGRRYAYADLFIVRVLSEGVA